LQTGQKTNRKTNNSQNNNTTGTIPVFLSNESVKLQNQILKFAPH